MPEPDVIGEEISQSEQVDSMEDQSESNAQQSVASSSVEQGGNVIVLSSDEDNDFDQVTLTTYCLNVA